MTHTEYYLLVNGTDDASIIVDSDDNVIVNNDAGSSPKTLAQWLRSLESDYETYAIDCKARTGNDYETTWQVFAIHHGNHDLNVDCECVQYEINHNPVWKRGK